MSDITYKLVLQSIARITTRYRDPHFIVIWPRNLRVLNELRENPTMSVIMVCTPPSQLLYVGLTDHDIADVKWRQCYRVPYDSPANRYSKASLLFALKMGIQTDHHTGLRAMKAAEKFINKRSPFSPLG